MEFLDYSDVSMEVRGAMVQFLKESILWFIERLHNVKLMLYEVVILIENVLC